MSHRRVDLAVHFVAACLAVGSAALTAAAQKAKVESQVLLTAEPGVQYAISPKGQHVAAVVLRGSRQVMVYDGTDGPRFDEILRLQNVNGGYVAFSDDGNRYAYFGRVGQEFVVVVDGKEVHRGAWDPQLAAIAQSPVHQLGFTPGSKHWYVILLKRDPARQHWQMVIDGAAGPVSEDIIQPLWSPDGEHHAYLQKIDPGTAQPRQALIVDAKTAPYLAGEPQWTADSKHLFTKRIVPRVIGMEVLADGQPIMRADGIQLYMAPTGPGVLGVAWAAPPNGARHAFLTVGNRKVPGSECTDGAGLSNVFISSDAKHFAARCRTWIMTDGKKGQEYAEGVSNASFTADGRSVYQGRTNNKSFLIVGDQESDAYSLIIQPSTGTRANGNLTNLEQAPATIRGNKVGYIARSTLNGAEYVVVVDGKKMPALNATSLTFSPDGSRFAFLAGHPAQSPNVDGTAYTNMTVDPAIGNIGFQGTFQWSADNKHVAWITAAQQGVFGVGLDGKLIAAIGMPRYLKFTADGKHLVWLVRAPPGSIAFVDGEKVLELPDNLALVNEADIRWSFPEDGTIVFIAQDGDAMKRFKITPGSETSVETALAKAK